MTRSDLLVSIVKAGTSGDKQAVKDVTDRIIAEERAKNHHILADSLHRVSRANGHSTSSLPLTANKELAFLTEINPRRKIDDIFLSEDIKQVCQEFIEEQHRASLLRSHGLEPRHKLLLIGPPGNGKTSLAEAIAESLCIPLFIVRYDTLIGRFLGETAERLAQIFDYTRTRPCVLFFDEFDAICKERGDDCDIGEMKRVVASWVMHVDSLPSYNTVIGATNHPELLDKAIWRRFQSHLELKPPNSKQIVLYLGKFEKFIKEPLGRPKKDIANMMKGMSFADLEEFCLYIQRQWILSLKEMPVSNLVTKYLKMYTSNNYSIKKNKIK